MKICHPDKNDAPNAAEVFQSVQKAWECIQNTSEEEIVQFQVDTAQQKRAEEVSRGQYKAKQQNPTSHRDSESFYARESAIYICKDLSRVGQYKGKTGGLSLCYLFLYPVNPT